MRKTITPCLIQKKSSYFVVKFPEYPDCSIQCRSLEDCLIIAPAYLSTYMLSTEQEFIGHTKPLTPKTENKDQIFTLIACNMDDIENSLSDFEVTSKDFLQWLLSRTEEPAPVVQIEEQETSETQEGQNADNNITETVPPKENKPAPVNIIQNVDDVSEFDAVFNNTSKDATPQEPVPISSSKNNKPVIQRQKPNIKSENAPKPENSIHKEPVSETLSKPNKDETNKDEGLKNKVMVMDNEKKNNSGVFGIIEEQELEFVSTSKNKDKNNNKDNNKTREKSPAVISNRQQQNLNRQNNNYHNKKKKDNK